jgi:hypothetical protein
MYGELLPLMERSKILHWVRKSLPYEILDDAETRFPSCQNGQRELDSANRFLHTTTVEYPRAERLGQA